MQFHLLSCTYATVKIYVNQSPKSIILSYLVINFYQPTSLSMCIHRFRSSIKKQHQNQKGATAHSDLLIYNESLFRFFNTYAQICNRILKMEKKILFVFILLWIGITLSITLWPFNFKRNNGITSTIEGGFHFESPAIVYLSQVPAKMSELKKFSIIMEVKPDTTLEDAGGAIFGYCIDHINQNFLMAQGGSRIIFFMNVNGVSHLINAEGFFEENSPIWITITYDGNKITFLKNGLVKKVVAIGDWDFSRWNSSYLFTFGNSGDGMLPWSGTIISFDIFDSVITMSDRQQLKTLRNQIPPLISLSAYPENVKLDRERGDISTPSLIIPAMFKPPGKDLLFSLLHFPERRTINETDLFLNFLLFVPFGFLLRLLLKKYFSRYSFIIVVTIVAGMFFSISIESLQSYLPTRYTSVMDVLSNTSGTIAGFFIGAFPWIRKLFTL